MNNIVQNMYNLEKVQTKICLNYGNLIENNNYIGIRTVGMVYFHMT